MATAANRILTRHHGPELPPYSCHISSASRFWSPVPQCGIFLVNRCNQMVYLEGRLRDRRPHAVKRIHRGSLQRNRARKSDNSIGRSKDGAVDGEINEDAAADSETDEVEDVVDGVSRDIYDEKAAQPKVSKGSSGFWRNLWGKVRQEIDEVNEAEADDEANDEDSDSEQEEEWIVVEVKEEEIVNPTEEDLSKTGTSRTGFWRSWWKGEAETPDREPGAEREDDLLLRDLENLQFRWNELLQPSSENFLALGLTALLALAGLQIVWQMVVVATAITLSALKYTVLAAIIVGLLILLL